MMGTVVPDRSFGAAVVYASRPLAERLEHLADSRLPSDTGHRLDTDAFSKSVARGQR
jgi:hypothetical protein